MGRSFRTEDGVAMKRLRVWLMSIALLSGLVAYALVALASVGYGIAIVPSTVLLTVPDIRVVPVRNARGLLGLWIGLVMRCGTQRPHVLEFVEEAARCLGKAYPGKELNLPALPGGKFRGAAEVG